MIGLSALTEALCAQITARTGVPAFDGRLRTAVWPAYLVTAQGGESTLFAAGRQLLRQVALTVRCADGRGRDENGGRAMLDALYPAILPSFSAGGRVFCPERLTADEEDGQPLLRFTLEFCDLPGVGSPPESPAMERLTMRLGTET